MTDLEAKRAALARLDARLAEGEISAEEYERLRALLTSGLTSDQRAGLRVTPSPPPRSTSGVHFGPSAGATRTASVAGIELRIGTVLFDQWRIVRELGRGGFGAVFEAEDIKLDRTLAVKVLDPSMAAKEELLARFRREVTLMRELAHERIVRVYDYREDASENLALISMEYVRGCSVREVLALARASQEPVPVALALAIFQQTLEALALAHAQGVIHRDVTPGNILLAGGTAAEMLADPKNDPKVKLVDFGIAGLVERTELSAKSRVLGTAAYVAPEVLDPDAEITQEADVYGAGAVTYELLTGKAPMVTGHRSVIDLRAEVPEESGKAVDQSVKAVPGERPSAQDALSRLAGQDAELERRRAEESRAAELRSKIVSAMTRGDEAVVERAAAALRETLGENWQSDRELVRSEAWLLERTRKREEEAAAQQAARERRQKELEAAAKRTRDEEERKERHDAGTVKGAEPAGESRARTAEPGESPKGGRRALVVALIAVVVVVMFAGGLWLKSSRDATESASSSPTPSADSSSDAIASSTPLPDAADRAKTAVLVIRSNVAGDVAWLDGEALGPTPQQVEVSPGRHLVRVTKDGCTAKERLVNVHAGARDTVSFELECATPIPTAVALTSTSTATNRPTPSPTPRSLVELRIQHAVLSCFYPNEQPCVRAVVTPSSQVAYVLVYFRAFGTEDWYFVRLRMDGNGVCEACLPKPEPSLAGIEYYLAAINLTLDQTVTQVYQVKVCSR